MTAAEWGLSAAVLLASIVEMVEALTIVMAMGMTRSWRSTLTGVAAALVALALFTAAAGYALATWLPEAALQLAIGTLLLIFGLQWLRKAVFRSAGRMKKHDEDAIYAKEVEAAQAAGSVHKGGLDWFSFVVSFKGVFLEGVEVVFIVITFGLSANNMPVAIGAAVAGCLLVLVVGIAVRGPLSRVPENTLKYGVGLLLAAFGTFWAVEGLGILKGDGHSLEWIGSDLAILALVVLWFGLSRVLVAVFRQPTAGNPASTSAPAVITNANTRY
jgi:Ca2+/H+ antiporter, TMEM165/GDT1 family